MDSFDLPAGDEAMRLAALRELMLLDTAPEPLFDQLVAWAAEACGVPIALVSLMDADRQWFKARRGLPDVTETPRELAFCEHAIRGSTLFEVPDAAADDRFAANPLVTGEPHIRFYAGVPLSLPGGQRIGTLCVIDRQPKTLSDEQARTLQRLAGLVVEAALMRGRLLQQSLAARSELERRLAASEARYRAIVEEQSELVSLARPDGTLEYVNPAYARSLGRQPAELIGSNLFDFIDPADRTLVRERFDWVAACGEPIVGENRMLDPQGGETWVSWTNVARDQPDGQRWISSVGRDISLRKRAEAALRSSERFVRAVTDNLDVRIAYVDRELRHRFVNDAYCRRFGLEREQVLGRTRAELFGRAESAGVAPYVAAVLRGQAQRFEFEEEVDGRPVRIESRLRPDIGPDGQVRGFFATGIDVTERHRHEEALRVLTTILDSSTDLIMQSGPRGELIYMNPAARRVVGIGADAPLDGLHALQFNTPQTNELIQRELLPSVRRDGVWRGETHVAAADGSTLPVSHLSIAHRDADDRLIRYSTVLRDISDEVGTRQELQRQGALLRTVAEALPIIVSAVDRDLRYQFVNTAFEQWHGVERAQVIGHSALERLSPSDVEQSLPWARRALAGETVSFERQYPARPGQPTLSVSYIPIRLDDGQSAGFVGVAFDITPHRREQVRLRSLAERDALTGLLNRAGFHAALDDALQAGHGPELALLYIDLDHFKPVNDRHGHATGDTVLQVFAARLTALLRPADVVARLGGDEFAVLLTGVRRAEDAAPVAQKVAAAAAEPIVADALTLHIGATVGVAHGVAGGETKAALLARADQQLYRAKAAGRGRVAAEPGSG